MSLFRRPHPVLADLDEGFWCAEADALQRSIVSALGPVKDSVRRVAAQLELSAGAQGRVVVSWRRRIVGFVPAERAHDLLRQVSAAAPAPLVATGSVVLHEDLWRIWAGPDWSGHTAPPALPEDELSPPPLSILGFPLRGHRGTRSAGAESAAGGAAAEWVLAVGSQSWDVRDGVDLDVGLLRSRIAASSPGDTLHVRVGEERVAIDLDSTTRVTLQRAHGGPVEVLQHGLQA